MRVRITFAKTDAMRFTSHLDLYRTWERWLRRARLPLAYSQGFRPHAHINLASALPLGFTSGQEVVDIWLESESPASEIESALNHAAPPGIQILCVEALDDRAPTLQKQLEASDFMITFLDPLPDLETRLEALLACDALPRQRRGKDYDLRPLILSIELLAPDGQGRQGLLARLAAHEGATGRPEELILALGAEPESCRVHRERLVFAG